MSVVKLSTINCDSSGDEKSAECHWWIGNEDTTTAARRLAKKDGWKRIDQLDLCPACAELRSAQ